MNALQKFGWTLLLAVALCCVGPRAIAAGPERLSTVAVVLGQGERAPSRLAEPMLIAALSKFPDVQLVEREAIRQVLDELKLNASGLVEPDKAIEFGKLAAAEAFILVENEPIRIEGEEGRAEPRPPLSRARLIETRTGIRLLDWLSAEEELKQGQGELAAELRRALGRLHTAEGGRHYVGVVGLRSEEPGEALIPTANALTALVEHDLGRLPSVVVLEREQLQRLTAERDLTGIELRLRASTTLLEGGLRHQGDAARLAITLKLIPLAGGEARQRQITTAAGDLGEMRRAVVRAIQRELKVSGDDSQAGDRRKEAKIFADRAQCLFSHASAREYPLNFEQRKQALPLAEAALALDPTVEHHQLAAAMCKSCVPPPMLGVESAGDLRYLHRAQQIDLAGTELRLRQPDRPQEEVVIGYRTIIRPNGGGAVFETPGFMRVDDHLRRLGPDDREQRRLLLEINAMCKRKFEALLELRRRSGATDLELSLLRLRHSWQLAADGKEFAEMIRTHVSALDRQFAAGAARRTSCERYYQYLWEQPAHTMLFWRVAGRRINVVSLSEMGLAEFLPAYEWLAKHDDPATRAVGYYGISALGGKQEVDAAAQLLEIVFHKIPKDHPLPTQLVSLPLREAAGILNGAGKMAAFFEAELSQAERSRDATILVRCPGASEACADVGDPAVARDFFNRLIALIDARAFDPRFAEAAKQLRELCDQRLARLDNRQPVQDLGPWRDYVIQPMAITGANVTREYLVGACIDRSPEKGGGEELVLVWWNLPKSLRTEEALPELIATRVSIRKKAMREAVRWRMPFAFAIACMAAGDGKIFLGTTQHGLAVISAEAAHVLDESKGAPGAYVERLAWLDGRVYLALSGTIASFDPATRKFNILASSKSVRQRHPLDGGQLYDVTSLLSDPQRHCLWISIGTGPRAAPGRAGIWRYTPATDSFELVMEGRAAGLSWSDGTLFYSTTWHNFSPGVDHTMGYFQLDPERLTVKPLAAYQLRGGDVISALSRRRPGDGWVLVGSHIVVGPGRLYTPQGKSYYYDPAKAALPSDRLLHLGESDRRIIGRLGRGFVIVQYPTGSPPPNQPVKAPFLWYVEPREVGENPGRTKP